MHRILCDRTPARELGSGLTWLKKDGQIVEFATMQEAGALAKDLTERATVTNVKYTAKKYNSEND